MTAADPLPLAAATAIVFLAAIVRGYSGFGFSLLAITALSLLYPPAEIIPSIFLLEIAASLHLLPSIWKDIHWRSLLALMAGALIGTPIGAFALSALPQAQMTLALSIFVMAAAILLWKGFALKTMPGTPASLAIGTAAGAANGAFGMAGPPVILFYFASPAGAAVGRASLIFYFLMTDVTGLGFLASEELVTERSAVKALIFLPALALGVWIGARSFKGSDPERFRRIVLCVIALLAVITAIKAIAAL